MKKFLSLATLVFMVGAGYVGYKKIKYYKEPAPLAVEISQIAKENDKEEINVIYPVTVDKEDKSENPVKPTWPEELNLKVPFYAQAPFGNWDYPWQEACEEASVLLVANVFLDKNWSRDEFNNQILQLVDYENKKFGDYKHTNVAQTARMIEEKFALKTVIHANPSFEDVKKILNKGHLIIVTLAGKHLKNPFYKNGGPVYHALVIKGYKKGEKVITNDVGTKQGADYVYAWATIEEALHDYAEPIEDGGKRLIEVGGK